MHAAEIIVLIAGAILFTVSFFMSDRSKGTAVLDEEEERKLIRELLDKEVEGARFRIDEAAQEAVSENKDRMERAMDRITNEKMSAVDEYSNTVLDQIHKNHDEVMFLYDMLNNKHTQVKNTVAELNQLTKSAKVAAESVAEQAPAKNTSNETVSENKYEKGFGYVSPTKSSHQQDKVFGYTDNAPKTEEIKTAEEKEPDSQAIFEELPAQKVDLEVIEVGQDIKPVSKKKTKTKTEKAEKTPVSDGNVDLMFASDNNTANSNDRILELHKAGKSNMAIAKELGLGIGEVKLVIDLFEGI